VHERYRQTTDRQTDGRAIAYSEREREFTFAKNGACSQRNTNRKCCKYVVHPTALIPMTLSQCEGKGGLTQGKRVRHHNHFSSHIHYISCESRREMYTGHGRLCVCVCLCVCACLSVHRRIPILLHGPGCKLGE